MAGTERRRRMSADAYPRCLFRAALPRIFRSSDPLVQRSGPQHTEGPGPSRRICRTNSSHAASRLRLESKYMRQTCRTGRQRESPGIRTTCSGGDRARSEAKPATSQPRCCFYREPRGQGPSAFVHTPPSCPGASPTVSPSSSSAEQRVEH